jgi:hypothetical protein
MGSLFCIPYFVAHMRSNREAPEAPELLKSLTDTFLTIDVRWNAAGTISYFYPFL